MDGESLPAVTSVGSALSPDETVLRRWSGRGGSGILTDRRILVFGPRRPIRREILMSQTLEGVTSLSVEPRRGEGVRVSFRSTMGGGTVASAGEGRVFGVYVNEVPVYAGDPNPCAELQRMIDDARTARCLAVYGRLVPYAPPATEDAAPQSGPAPFLGASAGAAPTPDETGSGSFLLFISGMPFKDAVPGAGFRFSSVSFANGAPLGAESLGDPLPADAQPGQIFGPQAEMARMVLDIARKCEVSVKVVNVDHPAADRTLVERWVPPDGALPLLVRPDGVSLSGEESMVPARVSSFLQHRGAPGSR